MGILIRGGRVVDAAAQIDKIADVYLDDGVIQKVGEKLEAKDKDDKIIDAKGLVVMPGLVDLHVHFRDPGQTEKEDIETGSHAGDDIKAMNTYFKERQDGRLVHYEGSFYTTIWQWNFKNIEKDTFSWESIYSKDCGKTWKYATKVEAKREM